MIVIIILFKKQKQASEVSNKFRMAMHTFKTPSMKVK